MSYRGIGFGLIATAGLLLGAAGQVLAQQGETNDWGYSGNPSVNAPLPIGSQRPVDGGFYAAAEFIFMTQSNGLGHQVVGIRGFVDANGSLTGTFVQNTDGFGNPIPGSFTVVNGQPGSFWGSGADALDTTSMGRSSWAPGYRATVGYKFEDGDAIEISELHVVKIKYTTEATGVPPGQISDVNLSDTFLYSPVFNFSPQFSGPPNKIQPDPNRADTSTALYGIWNGASQMDTAYTQRFDNWDITYRKPVFDSDWSRTSALAGVRRSWLWESYRWLTLDVAFDGTGPGPQDQALYSNVLSQVMYGPFIGVGNEIYLGTGFAFQADLTAAPLLDFIHREARYQLLDGSTESKRGQKNWALVPNVNASFNLAWYPIQGMSVKLGYTLMSYFNTEYMQQPVGFNVGAIDPAYGTKVFRLVQGFTFGVGINF
jgi:hypothetical protein